MLLGEVNEKALHDLGWAQLCGELAARARTEMGKERCRTLLPGDDAALAEVRLARVEEARALRRLDKEVPLAEALDVRAPLGRAARQGTLEPGELIAIARLIRAASSARRFCYTQADRAPLHFELGQTLSELDALAQELERAFDPAGKLLDTASALLGELRERARGLHRAIKARLEEMLLDETVVGMLRDQYYSVRGDRYVLPVRAEHKTHLPGIVHNASGSGQTLFVEPQQMVELGNQLTIAGAGILEEEQRILAELSARVGARAPQLEQDVATLALLDESGAGARLADDLGATAPALGDGAQLSFELKASRHPLLVLQTRTRNLAGRKLGAVVANDIALPAPARALIVSGPNAGGKTVTITAVGLAALMARAGLPVCGAEGSRVPLYRTVYTAINDEGDLSRDLSTFTAHLSSLRHILEAAGPGTLVLIDEIAADTDPREGAAIAVAALEQLVAQGAQVLITTHLEELKALGLADERFASASVGFDVDRLAPTYELRLGEVGASSAIEIARRVGLPEALCERARGILGGGSSNIAQAVEKLDRARAEAERAREEAQALREELKRERARTEEERERLRQAEREVRSLARTELIADLEAKYQEARRLIAQLQAAPTVQAAVAAQKAVEAMAQDERREAARDEVREEEAEPEHAAAPIAPGLRVKHLGLGSEGVVVEVSGQSAVVQLGALKTKVALTELAPLGKKAGKAQPGFKKTRAEKMERAESARAAPVDVRVPRIDVRGQRVDEALRTLELEMDRLLRAGEETVQVLHGHGTGALKAALREHLARSPYVAKSRGAESHEGGDGVTVITLRG